MKVCVALIILLASAGFLFAQGESGGCDLCAKARDNTCSSSIGCPSPPGDCSDGVAVEFTAPCTRSYNFKIQIAHCWNGNCSQCIACAHLKKSDGTVIMTRTAVLDGAGGCESSCTPADSSVSLTQGETYTLCVRLRKCPLNACTNCTCEAGARIWNPNSYCTEL